VADIDESLADQVRSSDALSKASSGAVAQIGRPVADWFDASTFTLTSGTDAYAMCDESTADDATTEVTSPQIVEEVSPVVEMEFKLTEMVEVTDGTRNGHTVNFKSYHSFPADVASGDVNQTTELVLRSGGVDLASKRYNSNVTTYTEVAWNIPAGSLNGSGMDYSDLSIAIRTWHGANP